MSSLTLSSPAKINLFLHILGRRPDGYHNLQTAFQFLDFSDTISFNPCKNGEIRLYSSLDIPEQQNLVWKAAKSLQQHAKVSNGVEIRLTKRIPIGGGLGGGSSNAATALVALNHLWETRLSTQTLESLARSLGADVPIFVRGQTSWAEGIGEQLTPIEWPEHWYVVVIPPCSVNTAQIFSHPQLTRDTPACRIADFLSNPEMAQNDFEPLVRRLYPPVDAALRWLGQFRPARLTGSGSSVFASFAEKAIAQQVLQQLPDNCQGFIAKAMNRSPLYTGLDKINCKG